MKIILAILAVLVAAVPVSAQDTKIQAKTVIRPTFGLSEDWYVSGWNITNFRQDSPDNTNLMLGLGFRQKRWWLEAMAQRQYALKTSQWFLDFRFQAVPRKGSRVFIEHAPFLERKALFQFLLFEQTVKNIGLGFESENIYGPTRNSIGIGPRLSLPPIPIGSQILNVSVAYQLRHKEPSFVRFYFVVPVKIR